MDTARPQREDAKSIIFRYIHDYNLRRASLAGGGLPPPGYRKNYGKLLQSAAA